MDLLMGEGQQDCGQLLGQLRGDHVSAGQDDLFYRPEQGDSALHGGGGDQSVVLPGDPQRGLLDFPHRDLLAG